MGTGNGGFVGGGGFSVGGPGLGAVSPRSLAIADVNLDGKLDVATANASTGNISVLLGNGSGGFMAPVKVAVGGFSPEFVLLGDFDLDGYPDVATANTASGNTSVLLNTGHGFSAPTFYATGYYTNNLALGDVSGDGIPDLVVGAYIVQQQLLIGDGTGAFPTMVSVPNIFGSISTQIADINGDGIVDIVTANSAGFTLLLGAGGLVFTSTPYILGASQIAVADLDGDGRPEIVGAAGSIQVSKCLLGAPLGLAPYGTGTGGCIGRLGVLANSSPHINNPQFTLLVSNGTPDSLGLGIVTDTADGAGSDPFALGVLLQVDLFTATELYALDVFTNSHGDGFAAAPIPNNPALIGKRYYFQALLAEKPGFQCSASPFHLVSSRGLALTILP